MVSLEVIRRSFINFINELSEKAGKKLSNKEIRNYPREIEIFIRLLEEKGFWNEAGELKSVNVTLKKNNVVDKKTIKRLREILVKLNE